MRPEDIDRRIRESLRHYKPAYKEELWAQIEAKLPVAASSFRIYWISAAAILCCVFGSSFLNFRSPSQIKYFNTLGIAGYSEKEGLKPVRDNGRQTGHLYMAVNEVRHRYRIRKAENIMGKSIGLNGQSGIDEFSNSKLHKKNDLKSKDPEFVASIALELKSVSTSRHFLPRLTELPVRETKDPTDGKIPGGNKEKGLFCFNYSFWNNPALTGEGGRVAVSADNRIILDDRTILKKKSQEVFVNHFGLECRPEDLPVRIGVFHERHVSLNSIYRRTNITLSTVLLKRANSSLAAGIGAAFHNKKVYEENLLATKLVDPVFGFIYPGGRSGSAMGNYSATGLDAGFWYDNRGLSVGVSFRNLNSPKLNDYTGGVLAPTCQLAMGYRFQLNKAISCEPWLEVEKKTYGQSLRSAVQLSYKRIISGGLCYNNTNTDKAAGDVSAFLKTEIHGKWTLFASYGQDLSSHFKSPAQQILYTGLRMDLP